MSYKFYLQSIRSILVAMFFTQCFAPVGNIWDGWETPQRSGSRAGEAPSNFGSPGTHDSVDEGLSTGVYDFDGGLLAVPLIPCEGSISRAAAGSPGPTIAESMLQNPLGDDYETPRRGGLDAKDASGAYASVNLGTPVGASDFDGGLFAAPPDPFDGSLETTAVSAASTLAEPAQQNPQTISPDRLQLGSAKSAGGKPARRKPSRLTGDLGSKKKSSAKQSRLAKDSAKPKSPVLTFFQREEQAAETLGEQLDEVQEAIHYRNLVTAVRRLLLCSIGKELTDHKTYGDKVTISMRGRFKRILHSMSLTRNMIIKRIWFAQILALEICEIFERVKLSPEQEVALWTFVVKLITAATGLICSLNQKLHEIIGDLFFINNLVEFLLEKQTLSDATALLMLGRLDDPGLTKEQRGRTKDRIANAVGKKELCLMAEKDYESTFLDSAQYGAEQKALLRIKIKDFDAALNVLKKFIYGFHDLHFMSPLLNSLLKEQFLEGAKF